MHGTYDSSGRAVLGFSQPTSSKDPFSGFESRVRRWNRTIVSYTALRHYTEYEVCKQTRHRLRRRGFRPIKKELGRVCPSQRDAESRIGTPLAKYDAHASNSRPIPAKPSVFMQLQYATQMSLV